MRIIAGVFRGRKLVPPAGDATRPITDRAKQSLFDILTPLIPAAHVYDCFAGTGSMGLECLSRGAEHVTFFESDRLAAKRLLENITTLGVSDRSSIVPQNLFQWFAATAAVKTRVDLIFLDPPYHFLRERTQRLLSLAGQMVDVHLSEAGTVVFRHDSADRLELPALVRYDQREYGGMTIEFLRPGDPPSE